MSMHLVGPYMTTTKYNSKGKKIPNSEKERKAKAEHEAWLRKKGLHPDQRANKKKAEINRIPDYKADIRNNVPLSNAVGNGFKTGVMENLHKEKPDVQKEILAKASRCMPLYNKGGYQYATEGTDMKTVGSKSRRG
jgi:hypothetical protein